MNFDLVDMQLLVHIAEEQSLTGGAERSHLSLPSASMRIKAFEEALGTKLLYRARQGATLTPAGQKLVQHARIVLGQMEALRGDLHEYAAGLRGHVRLHANATSISASLPAILRAYLREHPDVDVDLRERLSADGVRAVADGSADIAIVAGGTPTEGLEVLPYGSEALVLATAAGHPLARRRRTAFVDTLEHPYVSLQQDSTLHRFLVQQAHAHRAQLAIRIQVGSFDAICRMIEAGVGIGVLPASTARRYAEVMELRVVALSDAWAVRDAMVCTRSLAQLPAFSQRLVAMLGAGNAACA